MSAANPPEHAAGQHAGERPVERARRVLLELRDRARVSDPGLGRLRAATGAVVCVGTALPVQLAVGSLLGYPTRSGFATALFGAVVAMLAANALVGADRKAKARTAAFFPVAVAAGLVPATLTDGRQLLQVAGFAVVLFLAVWVRRFGLSFFFYGFMAWMGFFFATFLQATWALLPELMLASVVSTGWVLLLATTLLRSRPRTVLRSTLAACFAAGRAVAREAADLLEVPASDDVRRRRALRSLAGRQAGLAEAALLADAWSAEPGAVPEGWSAPALRRRLLEAQQSVERFGGSARALADAPVEIREEAHRALDHLARRRDLAASVSAQRLRRLADDDRAAGGQAWWPARHLAYGVQEFLRFDAAVREPPEVDPGEAEFESATNLVFGALSGAPAVARDVAVRGSRRNPFTRVSMTTRQATQVMLAGLLAIALGFALSPTRYYWAVIAAFVTFTGTGTRSETFIKGAARIGGTVLGLVAAIVLAHLTAGHSTVVLATILVSVFLAFYLQKVSYAAMTFFITLLLGQLYTVLGTFSDSLLALRLGETAIGAVAGVVVALLFVPLSTRDTVRSARDALYDAMADLLDGAAAYAVGPMSDPLSDPVSDPMSNLVSGLGSEPAARPDLDSLTRTLDERARAVSLVARPMTRTLVFGSSSRGTRRRLGLLIAAVSQCRALTLALQARPVRNPEQVAAACTALAAAVRTMSTREVGEAAPEAGADLARGDRALFEAPGADRDDDPVVRHLHHLAGTLTQLADAPVGVTSTRDAQPA